MCGIAGYVAERPGSVRERLLRMQRALVHRGPDEGGLIADRRAGLAIRRLAIVGIEDGAQPILSEDGRLALVGNGEIYNAPELRRALEGRGHVFGGGSDIEVALHLYEEEGTGAFARLDGMFALALLERETGAILVARDRLGIKPLYYAATPAGHLFASEIAALRAALEPGESSLLETDPAALRDYLTLGYIPSPRTIHRGIRRLPPGHWAWLTPDAACISRWWQLPEIEVKPGPDEIGTLHLERWAAGVRELLADSVRRRTLGDVRPGALLSGGIDSGAVTALLARSLPAPVAAFTIAFDERSHDELVAAARTAQHAGVEHHVERLARPELDEIVALFRHVGEPFADVSLLPTHRVARLAARSVKFVLTGDGADELFAGYSWLLQEVRWRRLPRSIQRAARLLSPLLLPGARSLRGDLLGKALRAAADIAAGPVPSFLRRRSLCPPALCDRLLHPRLRADGDDLPPSPLERHSAGGAEHPFTLLLDLDRRFYLNGDILEKVDRATMMHSLEARVPYLDHRLVELAATIPVGAHLSGSPCGKAVLRRAVRDLLPAEAFSGDKRGFGIPVDAWLAGPLHRGLRDRLLDGAFRARELIDARAVEQVLEAHRSGAARHGHLLWGLLSLAVWATECDAAPRPQQAAAHASASCA